ncbi:carboxypeptidase regulatory-like domain-containing protein [Roseisolibacter sp. H3M3-2]|uniref:carboxypeptidase regulatory-like domain-containing protein n=1 Tax=Roseisolibacter sp. H3M3-2 TaxID=3031323 RepID=UPI0023DC75B0|nr:carboxypeptidase regulatory-like domain-containing protein [Roseisolibacter sp. H3M3-2]MDF1503498.1 carboxypeptidase regulatory-like domain-containing protein [Roseisolibacter sp. H3M3-2]
MRSLRLASLGAALAAAPALLHAQATGAVRVRVTDPTGAPVPEATVSLIRGVKDTVAVGTTGADGVRLLTAPVGGDEVQLVVRRIGFQRADQFLLRLAADTLPVAVALTPSAASLDAVRVTDRQTIRRRLLFIDADEIAASALPITSALDVVAALRPVMLTGLTGDGASCGGLAHVWVNGRNVRLVPPDPVLTFRQGQMAYARRVASRLRRPSVEMLSLDLQSILNSIRPEHIASMQATDCNDPALEDQTDRSRQAVFVTLKPGIDYREGIGSVVIGPNAPHHRVFATRAPAESTAAEVPAETGTLALPMVAAERLPTYRLRLLGVFDEESGAPLGGVHVVDVKSGARTVTSPTGTATLALLPEGGGTVRLEREGYVAREVAVVIAPADTVPVTTLLARVPKR